MRVPKEGASSEPSGVILRACLDAAFGRYLHLPSHDLGAASPVVRSGRGSAAEKQLHILQLTMSTFAVENGAWWQQCCRSATAPVEPRKLKCVSSKRQRPAWLPSPPRSWSSRPSCSRTRPNKDFCEPPDFPAAFACLGPGPLDHARAVVPERLQHRVDDAVGVDAGLGILLLGLVLVLEAVGEAQGAQL